MPYWITFAGHPIRLESDRKPEANPEPFAESVDEVLQTLVRYLGGAADPSAQTAADPVTVTLRLVDAFTIAVPQQPAASAFENGIEAWVQDATVILGSAQRCLAEVDIEAGTAVVEVLPDLLQGRGRWVPFGLVLESLLFLLRPRGVFSMHAAAVAADPEQGVLICAPADHGKSTLTMALLRQGWSFLSDDTVVLVADAETVVIQGVRHHFMLDADAVDVFPNLADARQAPLFDDPKWAINADALFPGQRLETATPQVLLFPEIADAPTSELVPVRQAEAMRRVLSQSSLILAPALQPQAHLETLRRLTAQVESYRLLAGRDILAGGEHVSEKLRKLLVSASPV